MISDIRAIDVHAHYGDYVRSGNLAITNSFSSGSADNVVQRARDVNVVTTIVSPLSGLLPRGEANSFEGNAEALDVVDRTPRLQYISSSIVLEV